MLKKITLSAFFCIIAVLMTFPAAAVGEPSVINTEFSGSSLTIYTNSTELSGCTVTLGAQECRVDSYRKTGDVPSDTLILVDGSASIPQPIREKIRETLEVLIDGKQENERFALASFKSEAEYICDFTADRYELIKALDKLEYTGNSTYLYSVLGAALDSFKPEGFGKIILISDGAENSSSGITYDEILMKLSSAVCPVYTLGIDGADRESTKKFYAFSRNTCAESITLSGETNVGEVCGILNESRGYVCLNAVIPENIADGSVKYLQISGNGFSFGRDIRLPVHISAESTAAAETVITSPEPSAEETGDVSDEAGYEDAEVSLGGTGFPVWAAASAVLAVIVIIAVGLAVRNRRVSEKKSSNEDDATVLPHVKLTDVNSPGKVFLCFWENNRIVIGRSRSCAASIAYDGTVSREHAVLSVKDGKYYIENISKSKPIIINDKTVIPKADSAQEDTPDPEGGTRMLIPNDLRCTRRLSSGDIIRLGDTSVRVEFIE